MRFRDLTCTVLALLVPSCAVAASHVGNFAKVYVSQGGNVRAVTTAGHPVRIPSSGGALEARLSPDGRVIAWSVSAGSVIESDGQFRIADRVIVLAAGKRHSIACAPTVRGFNFWKGGAYIVLYCGGLHFAGQQTLYDTKTAKAVATFNDATVPLNSRPVWATQ